MKALILIVSIFAVGFAHAQSHQSHAGHGKKEMKQVHTDQKFVAPEDLQVRMKKVQGLANELKEKKNDSKQITALGSSITETVYDIFKNCKLEPKADAAVHPALAAILDGAAELKKGKLEAGQAKIQEGLAGYEKTFVSEASKK